MGRRPWTVHRMATPSPCPARASPRGRNRGPDLLRELPCLRRLREAGQRAHGELMDPAAAVARPRGAGPPTRRGGAVRGVGGHAWWGMTVRRRPPLWLKVRVDAK